MEKKNWFIWLFLFSSLFAQEGARFLIITHPNFESALQPLAEWKIKKGIPTKVVTLNETGTTPEAIRNYILNAYNTWPTRPEYILLVGSGNYLRSYNNRYDDYYGNMSGNYQQELAVGRFSCNTPRQCSVMVLKSINYEKNPYRSGDSLWILRGTTVVREDNPPDPYYQADARYIRNLVLSQGFIHTDSFLSLSGHNANDVMNAVNNGRSFLVYRGQGVSNWWSPFACNPNLCTNLDKLPIIVSATCQTMTFAVNESMVCEGWFRKGKPDSLTGALAVFGCTNTGSGVSLYRGLVSRGLFDAFFNRRLYFLGDALKRGKFYMDSIVPNQTRYQEWNLLGDPLLPLYTKKPRVLEVVWDSLIFLQPQTYRVLVRNLTEMESALVCLKMDSTLYHYGYTRDGVCEFYIQPGSIGSFDLTVTCPNYLPFEVRGRVSPGTRPYLLMTAQRILDRGNYDGRANPGESVGVFLRLANIGGSPANNVWAKISSSDRFVTLLDSIKNFGTIPPNETLEGGEYLFLISPACTAYHRMNFRLKVYCDEDSFSQNLQIPVYAGRLKLISARIVDSLPFGNGNGRIGPNEACKVRLLLKNTGNSNLSGCFAQLKTQEGYLSLTDSSSLFGAIQGGESLSNNYDHLTFITSPSLPPGIDLNFLVKFSGFGRTYLFLDSTILTFRSEGEAQTNPQGPCPYGYFAYDNTDTLSGEAPVYAWFEIAPPGPGRLIPEISTHDAATVTLPLPFRFKYYGINYDSISISSNGFLALGRTDYRLGNNSSIPDTTGPPAMLAPFWDDLNTNENSQGWGDVYEYYDTVNHRYFVEFNLVAHHQRPSARETFQTILLDPEYYPTPTGDGEILYQYAVIADLLSNTVGIEDHTETRGLQYLYNNLYHPNSAPLSSGRAIKFSTRRPRGFNRPFITLNSLLLNDSLGNGNGEPEPGERIKVIIYLRNDGDTTALSIIGVLKSQSPVLIIDSLSSFGEIRVGEVRSNLSHPFLFEIPETISDSLLYFYIRISGEGYSSFLPFEVRVTFPTAVSTDRLPLSPSLSLPTLIRTDDFLRLSFSHSTELVLNLFDPTGRKVRTIFSGRVRPGEASFPLKDLELPIGIYFLNIQLSSQSKEVKKLIWLK